MTSMANLASTYRNQGRWKEAEELEVRREERRRRRAEREVQKAAEAEALLGIGRVKPRKKSNDKGKERESSPAEESSVREELKSTELALVRTKKQKITLEEAISGVKR